MRSFLILISAIWAGAANAQDIEFWSQHDGWRVETYRYDDGRKFCMSTVQNGPGYLSFVDDGRNQTLLVQHQEWDFAGPTRVELAIDDGLTRSFADVPSGGKSVYIPVTMTGSAEQDILNSLAAGTRAAVKTPLGGHVWDLIGFAQARDEVAECVHVLAQTATEIATDRIVGTVSGELQTPLVFRDWTVDVIQDGPNALCSATVAGSKNAMHIYGGTVPGMYVRFLDPAWDFAPSSTDVGIRVDRRADWKIGNAQRNQNVIDIGVPENEASETFLENLKGGNWVYLYAKSGAELGSWSLAGSGAAIDAWQNCVTLLRP